MVPLMQMLEILNIKVIWMLMHLVIVYVIIAHDALFLIVSIILDTLISNNFGYREQLNVLLRFIMYLKYLCDLWL